MATVVFSVVLDLNLGLTVRTLNIFTTMYNTFTSFHSIDKHNTEQQVSRAKKIIIPSQMLYTLPHKYFASNCAIQIPTK